MGVDGGKEGEKGWQGKWKYLLPQGKQKKGNGPYPAHPWEEETKVGPSV